MKTTATIYDQQNRIYTLLWEVTTAKIKRAHPDTGGSIHLAHNWGNDAAKKYLEQYHERQHFLFNLFNRHYHLAFVRQYPDHLSATSLMDEQEQAYFNRQPYGY